MDERDRLAGAPPRSARALLGAVLHGRGVSVRLVEVEAYGGADDPASHAVRGPTPRNAVMFGPPGHLYAYLSYGIHTCVNVSTGFTGTGSAVLLRAGEVVAGSDVAGSRRPAARRPADLARGPGNLAAALGLTLADDGTDLLAAGAGLRLELGAPARGVRRGRRVGVSGAADVAWRFWVPSPAVSAYRRSPRAPG
ncbi:DNA-3-methyladenine glycosylase [Rhodococcus aerolatus]